jgi:undecaprenyl-diphosphatase
VLWLYFIIFKGGFFMDIFFILKAIILGIIEGLTEFLPVSSTGHLIIASNFLNFYANASKTYVDMFNMVIQLGAILAVVVLYRQKIQETILHFFPSSKINLKISGFYFWLMIFISCVPAAAIGLPFDDWIKAKFFNPVVVACALFIGGLWMLIAESHLRGKQDITLAQTAITPLKALIVGIFQVLSIIPGMSRSASTIIGGWLAGFSTVAAAEYSFFLAIPVMFGQALVNILKVQANLSCQEWVTLAVGFIVSFIVALLVIGSFLNYLSHKPMKIFAIYRIIFAFVVLLAGAFGLLHPILGM